MDVLVDTFIVVVIFAGSQGACPPRLSTESVNVTCIHDHQMVENCTQPIDGTRTFYDCKPFFEDFSGKIEEGHVCGGGVWDGEEPKCVPVCGTVVEGDEGVVYPWQVGFYQNNSLLCVGLLLSQKLVVTTEKCLKNRSGMFYPKDTLLVSLGEFYYYINGTQDFKSGQFSKISTIHIAEKSLDSHDRKYGNLAILVTQKKFTISPTAQPICLDRNHSITLAPENYGYELSWKLLNRSRTHPERFEKIGIGLVPSAACTDHIPPGFEKDYFTENTICAKFLVPHLWMWKGFRGAGLVFPKDGRFYLMGITSVVSAPLVYPDNEVEIYHDVGKYMDFILGVMGQYPD